MAGTEDGGNVLSFHSLSEKCLHLRLTETFSPGKNDEDQVKVQNIFVPPPPQYLFLKKS